MKLKIILAFILIIIIGVIAYRQVDLKKNKESAYIFYNPAHDQRFEWSDYQKLFPKTDMENLDPDILLGMPEEEKKLFDSISDAYHSQYHLIKEKDGTNFYLTISRQTSVELKEKERVKEIQPEKLADYPVISLDSFVKVIPGLQFLQLKNSDKIHYKNNLNFYVIEPVPGSEVLEIVRVEPVLIEYD